MRKRDLLLSILLAFLLVGASAAFHNSRMVVAATKLIREFQAPEASLRLPVTPYVLAFLRFTVFYVVAAAVVGLLLSAAAFLLTRPVGQGDAGRGSGQGGEPGGTCPLRRRYFFAYCALLVGFMVYVHLRMITLYPGLFRNSYRYAWFAGSSTCAFIVQMSGRIALVLVISAIVVRHRHLLSVRLVRARTALAAVVLMVFVGGAFGYLRANSREGPLVNRGPNIIFIGVDSARPDHVSGLGYSRPTTPNIDAFLRDAVVFDQAFAPLCRTYPAWIAVLTGCNPPTNGARFDLPPAETYKPRVPLISEHVKNLGYATAFFLNNTNYAWIEPSLGFDYICQPDHNAVDFYLSHVQPKAILYYYFLNNPLGYLVDRGLRYNSAFIALYRPEYFDARVVEHWRRMRGRERFLTAVHLCNLHAPLSVNYPYSTYFASVREPVFNRFTYEILVEEIARRKQVGLRWSKEEAERIFTQEINLYDALLRSADDSVGRILAGLKKAGLYDNSLIVLLSDHGEHLFSNRLRYRYRNSNHGNHLWGDDDQRVLLAIKFPHQRYAGRVVRQLVRTIDVVPTILEALDLPPLHSAEGVSLMPYVRGTTENMHLVAYAETGMTLDDFFFPRHLGYSFTDYFELHYIDGMRIYKKLEYMPNLIMAKDRMVRDERWKLIAYPVVTDKLEFYTELFDVRADPTNLNDVSTSQPLVRDRLRERLWSYIEADWKRWGHLLTDLPPSTGTAAIAPRALLERFGIEHHQAEPTRRD